jgi:hypothetical protein
MKKIVSLFFSVLLLSTFHSFSFAADNLELKCEDTPSVCSVAPMEFSYYVDFVREMLQQFKIMQTQ